MWIIFKYQLIQFRNYWRNTPFRIKIEITILLTIFYVYATEKLTGLFCQILEEPSVTPLGLNAFILQIILVLILFTLPFLYFQLLPRQKLIHILRLLPLNTGETAAMLLVHFWKYQLLFFLAILPVFAASAVSASLLSAVYLLGMVIFIPVIFLYVLQLLCLYTRKFYAILLIYYSLTLLYFGFFAFLYWYTHGYLFFQVLFLSGCALISYRYWQVMWKDWDLILEQFHPAGEKAAFVSSRIRYTSFTRFIPLSIRPVFIKEILAQIRSGHYLRLKIITLLVLLLGIFGLSVVSVQNFKTGSMILLMVLVWWHYGAQFNEKYVLPESRTLIKTQPFRFYQYWLPKFLSEFIFACILIVTVMVSLTGHGEKWNSIMTAGPIMILLAAVILFTSIIFRTLFYDKPRLAGYAYHFLLVFCLVMTANFYFIGPVITLFLFFFFFIKSYRTFSQ